MTIDEALHQRTPEVAAPTMDKADLFREAIQMLVRVQPVKPLVTSPNERRAV